MEPYPPSRIGLAIGLLVVTYGVARRGGFVALVAAAVVAGRLEGQVVRGNVVELRLGRPVAEALIRLSTVAGGEVAVAATDSLGRYRVHAPFPGEYLLSAEAYGYDVTTTPPFTVANAEGVYGMDVVLRSAVLEIEGLGVSVERQDAVLRRFNLMVGVSSSALRVPPIGRQELERHIRQGRNLEGALRWSNISSLSIHHTEDGPCFIIRQTSRTRIPESCVDVYLNGIPVARQFLPGFPLELVEVLVVVYPGETIMYNDGALLLYTGTWIR